MTSPSSISVVIPTCDRPAYLIEAVRSVLPGLQAEDEVIVCDDGTTQARSLIAGSFAQELETGLLTLIRTGPRSGPSAARNAGVAAARAPLILFLDDDDRMVSDYPDRVRAIAQDAPQAGYGFSTTWFISSPEDEDTPPASKRPRGVVTGHLSHKLNGLGTGFWIRKSVFEAAGGLDPLIRVGEDIDLCVRLAGSGVPCWFEPAPGTMITADHNDHEAQGNITRHTQAREKLGYTWRVYAKNKHLFAWNSRDRWFLMERYVRRSVKSRIYRDSLRNLWKDLPDLWAITGLLYWGVKYLSGSRY